MPLILAIEPDRRQSTKLSMLARNQLHLDLIIADSVEQAISTLDEVVPDLILASPMIPSTDGLALAERLREIDNEGVHVPIVVTPPLAVQGQRGRSQQKGSSAIRGRSASGCDPVVFGMQILAHLERNATERPADARAQKHAPQVLRAPQMPVTKIPEADTKSSRIQREKTKFDWSEVLNAMRREIEREAHVAQAEEIADPDVSSTVTSIEDVEVNDFVQTSAPQPDSGPAGETSSTASVELPRKKRRRKSPAQDEFGFFDPDRCGVPALIAKVNEITGKRPSTPKKPA
jgi:response regulator RpfG family c-di-GMP phosphodiesterase